MHLTRFVLFALASLAFLPECRAEAAETTRLASVLDSLENGKATVRVVCFGDSITGVYYHTGGRRAWCDMLGIALGKIYPKAEIHVTPWPVQDQSLADMEQWSKRIRKQRPHLVVVAVPADREAEDEETFIRQYAWVLKWSVDSGLARWDLLPILPSVTGDLTNEQRERECLARQIITGMDTRWMARKDGDRRPPDEIVSEWIVEQKRQLAAMEKP